MDLSIFAGIATILTLFKLDNDTIFSTIWQIQIIIYPTIIILVFNIAIENWLLLNTPNENEALLPNTIKHAKGAMKIQGLRHVGLISLMLGFTSTWLVQNNISLKIKQLLKNKKVFTKKIKRLYADTTQILVNYR